jgi:uncharacterized membrane protein
MIENMLVALAVLLRILSNPLGNVFQKKLTLQHNHPLLVKFLTYLILALLCSASFLFTGPTLQSLSPQFWSYSVLSGMAGALGNGFLVKALQKGDLSVLGPVNSYKSVIGIIVGIFLLHEIPNIWGFLASS